MPLLASILAVLVGLLGGILGGLKVGGQVRGRARVYWSLNALVVIVCMVLDFAGLVTGQLWLALGAVGLMGGSITGLKYGYSESIGVWRAMDGLTGADAGMRSPDGAEGEASIVTGDTPA